MLPASLGRAVVDTLSVAMFLIAVVLGKAGTDG
jgi:hypothetical protein